MKMMVHVGLAEKMVVVVVEITVKMVAGVAVEVTVKAVAAVATFQLRPRIFPRRSH